VWTLYSEILFLGSVLVGLRAYGLKFRRQSSASTTTIRWSMRQLIVAVALSAVTIKAVFVTRDWLTAQSSISVWFGSGMLGAIFALVTLLVIWAASSPVHIVRNFVLVILGLSAIAPLMMWLAGDEYADLMQAVLACLAGQGVVVGITLLVVRSCGYRIGQFEATDVSRNSVAEVGSRASVARLIEVTQSPVWIPPNT
jgi:hypothetical protein